MPRETQPPTSRRIDLVSPDRLETSLLDAWREMQRATAELANPFLSPEFTLAAASVERPVTVAVVLDADDLVAFFPFERGRFGLGRPVAAGLSDRQGVIHRPGGTWNGTHLLRACGLSVIRFDRLATGQTPFAPYIRRWERSPTVDLRHGYDAYLEQRSRASRSFRRSLAKQRAFEATFGEVSFELRSRDPHDLALLLRWKSAQFRRSGRPDPFTESWARALVSRLMATDHSGFAGLLSVLRIGERPIAIEASLTTPTTTSLWVPAYDPEFARFSPGIVLRRKLFEALAARGVQSVDMAAHPSAHKELLKSSDDWVAEAVIERRSPEAILHRLYYEPQRRVTRLVLDHERLRLTARRTRARAGALRMRLAEVRRQSGRHPDE